MKYIIIVSFTLFFLAACQNNGNKKNESTPATAELATVTLSVGGMTCAMCEASIEKGVSQLAGVDSVSATLGDSSAYIRYNPQITTLAEITRVVEMRGYKVKSE